MYKIFFFPTSVFTQPHHNIEVTRILRALLCVCLQIVLLIYINQQISTRNMQTHTHTHTHIYIYIYLTKYISIEPTQHLI